MNISIQPSCGSKVDRMNDDAVDLVMRYNEAWFAKDLPAMAGFLGEDLVLWHNHIGRAFSKNEMLGFIASALDVIETVEFRNPRRTAMESGVVQQHDMYVTMKDGTVMESIPNCIVYTVKDKKIRRIEEYVDGPALKAVKIEQ
jgi:ketosteroid isomerase-like protein